MDEAIRPLANVSVELLGSGGPKVTATNDGGAFGFDGLDPGTYFLKTFKPGYFPIQQSVVVVAGDTDHQSCRLNAGNNA